VIASIAYDPQYEIETDAIANTRCHVDVESTSSVTFVIVLYDHTLRSWHVRALGISDAYERHVATVKDAPRKNANRTIAR